MIKSTVNFKAGLQATKREGAYLSRVGVYPGLRERLQQAMVSTGEQETPARPLAAQLFARSAAVVNGRGERIGSVKKIAVLRSNGIGDYLFAVPALEALRHTYPEAEIVLLGLKWHEDFLRDRPGPVDRVEVVPPTRGVGSAPDAEEDPRKSERFFQKMAQERFDLAIQMHGGGRYSNPFIQRLGAQLTVGACAEDAIPLDRWVPYQYYQMEVLRFLEIASLVGARPVLLEPEIHLLERDLSEAAGLLPYSHQPLVVLHPGASDPRRRWPAAKFAAVGNALSWNGAQVIVTGNQPEAGLAEEVVQAMSAPALNLAGKVSLGGLAAVLSRSRVVISNDSGPLHLARAVGAATVGIYWIGNMINAGPVTRARHRTAVSWRIDCPVCGLNCTRSSCGHDDSFVADVPDVEVRMAAMELLESSGPQPYRSPIEYA
jgi:ADP-heptose:LPS heptosyltransferase